MVERGNAHSSDTGQADMSRLSQSGQEVLALAEAVLKDFHPQPGALHDLPQVTVNAADIVQVCRLCKEDPRLSVRMLLCLACVDYKEHFQLVYFLQSLEPDRTLVVKADVPYDAARLPSVTSLWQAAEWYEREAHDLFGVVFEGHPNLAPLLLYEEFEGYPGRKEYPFYDYQEF